LVNVISAEWDVYTAGFMQVSDNVSNLETAEIADRSPEMYFSPKIIADNNLGEVLRRQELVRTFGEFAADLLDGRVVIAEQKKNAFTVFHSDDSQTTPPEDYDGLINVGVRIDGITALPTRGASLGFSYSAGNSESRPLGYDHDLSPDNEAKLYLNFTGASFTPDFDGPTETSLSVTVDSEYLRNSEDESVLNVMATVPFGGVFLVATYEDGRTWQNRSVSFSAEGSDDKFSVDGNYLTIMPPGSYSVEAYRDYSLGDCGTHNEPPEYLNRRWEISGLSCRFGDRNLERGERPQTDIVVEKGRITILQVKNF